MPTSANGQRAFSSKLNVLRPGTSRSTVVRPADIRNPRLAPNPPEFSAGRANRLFSVGDPRNASASSFTLRACARSARQAPSRCLQDGLDAHAGGRAQLVIELVEHVVEGRL